MLAACKPAATESPGASRRVKLGPSIPIVYPLVRCCRGTEPNPSRKHPRFRSYYVLAGLASGEEAIRADGHGMGGIHRA